MHGRLDGDQCRRCHPHGQGDGSRPHDRHDPLRLRNPLSEQIVQSSVPAFQGFASAGMAGCNKTTDQGAVRQMTTPFPLVSTEWLASRINAPDVRVADASWYLPQANRDPRAEYAAAHIPGAVFFDIDDLSDDASALPHML